MKKILSLMLALVAIATTARAQTDYGFYVGGVRVNSSNASNITGSDITSGTVSYNATTKTLTLNNVTISRTGSGTNGIDNESCTGLKIVFQGTNNLTNSGGAAVLKFQVGTTIECAANSVTNLTQNSSNDEGIYFFGGTVTFQGSGKLNIYSNCHGIEGKDATRNVIFNGPTVYIESKKECLIDIGSVTFRGASNVTLDYKSGTTVQRVYNVKNMIFENGQEIQNGYFDASQATIVQYNGSNSPITNSRIYINCPGLNVSVRANPAAGGTVTGTGISYHSGPYYYPYSGTYQYGTSVTLTATPNAGYRFVRWTENDTQVSTYSTISFTVTDSRSLVAEFEKRSYTVSASAYPTAGGTVMGAGTYEYGTNVTLRATASTGYKFKQWLKWNASSQSYEYASSNSSYSFTMGASDATYRAEFVKTYTITTTSTLAGVSVYGAGTYGDGETVRVYCYNSNIPTGYRFKCWTVNGSSVSTELSYSFTCTSNRELKAVFEYDNTASVVPSYGGTVGGSALGTHSTDATKQVTLTATPASSLYWFVRWKEGNNELSTNPTYTFTTDNKPHQYVAEFGLSLLDDNSANQNQVELSQNNGQKRSVVLKNRSLLKGQWNVLCLPFGLSSFAGTPLEGATVKALTSSSYNTGAKTLTMNFGDVTSMESGMPYLVYLNGEGAINDPVFYDVTLNSADPGLKETEAVFFLGAYSPFSLTEEHRMALYMGNDGKLHYPSSTVQVNAFRAYFQLTEETENVVLNFGNGWTENYSLTSGSSGQQATWTVVKIDNTAETEMVVTRNGGANETVACTTPFTTQTINPENLTKATLRVATTGEASEYSVYLVSYVENKILIIKAVKELAGLTLGEAKALVDSADGTTPVLIKTFATAEEAQAAKQTLEDLNAVVTMEVTAYAESNQSFKVYRNGVDVTAQGTADGNYLCFEVTADNLANTTWVITTEPAMPNSYDVNGDGVIDPQDARMILEKYMNQ